MKRQVTNCGVRTLLMQPSFHASHVLTLFAHDQTQALRQGPAAQELEGQGVGPCEGWRAQDQGAGVQGPAEEGGWVMDDRLTCDERHLRVSC